MAKPVAAARRDTAMRAADAAPPLPRRAAAALAALCVPALAFGLYIHVGEPGHVTQTQTAAPATAAASGDITAIVAQVEAHLASHPDDGRGYEVIAPVYLRMGRGDDAAQAYAAAIRLLGDSAEREANYGEALFAAAGSVVSRDARAAFDAAVALDEKSAKARYYLGLAAEQEGDKAKAKTIWSALAANAPADAPWAATVRQRLAELEAPAGAPLALAGMAPEQDALVRQMVDGLAERLAKDANDLAGWQKLVRAYAVLAEPDKARAALAAARGAFATDVSAMAALETLARDLGLGG